MIPVRIAAQLTAEGTDGVRWVLVDAEEGDAQLGTASPAAAEAGLDTWLARRKRLRWLLQAAVIASALIAAAVTTRALLTPREQPTSPASPARATVAAAAAALASSANRGRE